MSRKLDRHEEDYALDRPLSWGYTLRTDRGKPHGRMGVFHGPSGTVVYLVSSRGETLYETTAGGRMHRLRESTTRTERGAQIVAGKWLRGLQEQEQPGRLTEDALKG